MVLLNTLVNEALTRLTPFMKKEVTLRKQHSSSAILLMWETGKSLIKIHDHVSGGKGAVVKCMTKAMNRNMVWGYECMNLVERFTRAQVDRMRNSGLRMRTVKALRSIRSKSLRLKIMNEAIKNDYSREDVMERLGRASKCITKEYLVMVQHRGKTWTLSLAPRTPEEAHAYVVIEELAGNIPAGADVTILEVIRRDVLNRTHSPAMAS